MSYCLHADQIFAEVASNTNRLSRRVIDIIKIVNAVNCEYEGWNFNSGNYLFTTDTK